MHGLRLLAANTTQRQSRSNQFARWVLVVTILSCCVLNVVTARHPFRRIFQRDRSNESQKLERTCGTFLTARTQRICNSDCPPPGFVRTSLNKRASQKKTLLTILCCDEACTDEIIRRIFCCNSGM
ncbi:hypothetical protein M3Y98_00551400 [Aphelenchoides besseyi]|nr:hypothetical protein M3Y98_00551400 [Aphelenchoides besseyi]KAI6194105.1 hypothetical protein M3Y96_01089500 [Aphelenchoides besseyi]